MAAGDRIPVACSLDAGDLNARLAAWRDLVDRAEGEPEDGQGGLRLRFPSGRAGLAEVAALVAAELECCPFFRFRIDVDAAGVTLAVDGPPEARAEMLTMLAPGPAGGGT